MTKAELFNYVMGLLWYSDAQVPMEARAIAAYAKTFKMNPENAFDVLAVMWPDSRVAYSHTDPDAATMFFQVGFSDNSRCLVSGEKGIGSGIEEVDG